MSTSKNVLPGNGFRNKKRFGQNFLCDKNILREIAARAEIKDAVVLEIGPGQGSLTVELINAGSSYIHCVEIDRTLENWLRPIENEHSSRLKIHFADAVKFDYSTLYPFPGKAVANIPYNITTPLICALLPFAGRGLRSHIYTVQLEAAQRLMAKADTKERYPLGVALEVMGRVTLVRRVPPSCFRPAPRVDSAVVEIELDRNLHLMRTPLWSNLLHAGFRQRRKTLLNNLKGFGGVEDWRGLLGRAGIDPGIRAEDLSGEEWLRLYSILDCNE